VRSIDRGRAGALAGAVGVVAVAIAGAVLVSLIANRPNGATTAAASVSPSAGFASPDASAGTARSSTGAAQTSAAITSPPPAPSESLPPICQLGRGPLCLMAIQPSPIAVDGGDPSVVAAIEDAITGLQELGSYRYELELDGGRLVDFRRDEFGDLSVTGASTWDGEVSIDAEVTTSHPAVFGEDAETSTTRILVVDDEMWELPAGKPARATGNGSALLQQIYLPYGIANREILPFAAAYERIGDELRGGITTVHFRATEVGRRALAAAYFLDGTWAADLWLAADGRYLVEAETWGDPPSGSPPEFRGFRLRIRVMNVDDPSITIEAPPSP
jgi:hypothetical protein